MSPAEQEALETLSKAGWMLRRVGEKQSDYVLISPPQSREPRPNQCTIQFHGRWWTFDQLRELTRDQ